MAGDTSLRCAYFNGFCRQSAIDRRSEGDARQFLIELRIRILVKVVLLLLCKLNQAPSSWIEFLKLQNLKP